MKPERKETEPLLKALGIPTRKEVEPTSKAAVFRRHPSWSMKYATTTSRREMVEVKAAMVKRKKKAVPNNYPRGMALKMLGSTRKIRPAPSSGDRPGTEKRAGKIANPARNAISVSARQT